MNSNLTGLLTTGGSAIPLTGVDVCGNITGRGSRIKVIQHYHNTESNAVEAVYKFPLPEGSSIFGFRVLTDGKTIVGSVEERDKAFEIYDEALSEGHGGYLLDEERPNIFTLSVGNLNPGSHVTIELDYVSLLDTGGSEVRFFLPTTISPRYIPQDMPDVKGIPVDELVNPPLAAQVDYGLKISLKIQDKNEIQMLSSPSHTIATTYGDESITVELSSEKTAMDRDFILNIKYKDSFQTRGYLCRYGEEIYCQLDITPEAVENESDTINHPAQDIIFVLDCSGSMGGSSITEAKQALHILLAALDTESHFNIYRFGSTFEKLFKECMAYNTQSMEKAVKYLSMADANLGGTEILSPLQDIIRTLKPGRISKLVLITDGQVGNEEQIFDLVRGHKEQLRLFTVGIGNGPNEYFIKQLAKLSGGASELIAPNERIEPRVLSLFKKVNAIDAMEISTIDWGAKVLSAGTPDVLYFGDTASVFAKLEDNNKAIGNITISGKMGATEKTLTINPKTIEGVEIPVPVLWAREMIREYEEGRAIIRGSSQHQRKQGLANQLVIELSKKYGIISRSTSFVAVEERCAEKKTTSQAILRKVPVLLTNGWGGIDIKSDRGIYMKYCEKRPPILHQDRSLELNIPSFARSPICRRKRSTSGIPSTDSLGKYDICDNADSNFLFLHILSLQKATGGFLIDENFAQILNTTLEELKSIASKIHVDSSIDKFKLLSTALVLRYLEREHGSKRHIWEEVVRKSRKWIIKVITEHQPLYEKQAIIDFADDYVKMALSDS